MLILTFEEFNIDNAMSDSRIKDIGKVISLTPIEIVMRDQTPDSIGNLLRRLPILTPILF